MIMPNGVRCGYIHFSGKLSSTKNSFVGFRSKMTLAKSALMAMTATCPETCTRLSITRTSSPGRNWPLAIRCCASAMYSEKQRWESSFDGVDFHRRINTARAPFFLDARPKAEEEIVQWHGNGPRQKVGAEIQ